MSKELELYLYEMPENFLLNEEVYYMHFPKQLVEFVKKKQQENKFRYPIKLKPLNTKMKSLFSQIISLQVNDAIKYGKPWIIAKEEISPEQLKFIYKAYFKLVYEELKDKITDEDFKWQKGKIKEIQSNPYEWLPAIVAYRFAEKEYQLTLGDWTIPLTFYPITFNGINECVSEPLRSNKKDDYFSYVLRFKLVTRGSEGIERLFVSTGIRRYIQKPYNKKDKLFQSTKRSGSVLLSVENPFTHSKDYSFSQLTVKYAHPSEGRFSKWSSGEEKLFSDLLFGRSIESDQIFEDPNAYRVGKDGIRAFIVYSHHVYADKFATKVKTGMGLEERSKIFNLVQETFPELRRLPTSNFINIIGKRRGKNNQLPLISPNNITKIVLEVWGSHELYEKVIDVLLNKVIDKEEKQVLAFREEETLLLNANKRVEIKIEYKDPIEVIHHLELGKYGDKALQIYISNIGKKLPNVNGEETIHLALVEIDDLKGKEIDHKFGTRIGLARTGRIAQFIHPLQKKRSDEDRILNGVIDLLADAGFLRNNWNAFELDSTIMSLTLIKNKKNYIPVVTRIIGRKVEFKIYGIDKWLTSREILLNAGKAKEIFQDNNGETKNRERLRRFLVENIKDTLNNADQTLYLLLDATLRYSWMSQMSNPNLKICTVPNFDQTLKNDDRIKVIRINTTDEIPQYRIIKNNDEHGINKDSGLFRDPAGIYYSVGSRPTTWQEKNAFTKYNQPKKRLLQQRAVEFIPLGIIDVKERDEIAYWMDRLRRMNLTFKQHTEQPFPIHKAMAIKKYIDDAVEWEHFDEFDEDILME